MLFCLTSPIAEGKEGSEKNMSRSRVVRVHSHKCRRNLSGLSSTLSGENTSGVGSKYTISAGKKKRSQEPITGRWKPISIEVTNCGGKSLYRSCHRQRSYRPHGSSPISTMSTYATLRNCSQLVTENAASIFIIEQSSEIRRRWLTDRASWFRVMLLLRISIWS